MPVLPLIKRTGQWLSRSFIQEKMDNPLGYIVMIILALFVAYTVSIFGKMSIILPVLFIAIPAAAACLVYMDFGIAVSIIVAYLIGLAAKMAQSVPFGIALDALLFLMFVGMMIRQIKERDFEFAKNKISYFIVVWVIYNILSVFNPWAQSQMAWIFTVRSMAVLALMFFVAAYAFKDLKTIMRILKLIILMTTISAIYGLKQEFIGFASWEMEWLSSDEKRMQLIYQWTRIRVFGFFSDPTNYGMLLSYMATFCIVLITGPFKIWQKVLLGIAVVCMIASMGYAGSRTPFVLFPFGLFIFVLLKMNKTIMLVTGVTTVLAMAVIIKGGHNNAVLFRISSAFMLSKSADTMDVRFESQKLIQPYIHRHPIGMGLGSTGVWGARFSPNSFLSSFQHDSGLVRIAVELGWIALIMYCLMLYTILRTTIYYYFRVRNPRIKVIYLGLATIFFQLVLASYPQEAIIILPTSINFYVFLAILVRLKDFDDPPLPRKKNGFGNYAKAYISVKGVPIDKPSTKPDLEKAKGGRKKHVLPFGINLELKRGGIWRK